MFADVALPVPGLKPLTYRVPPELQIAPGSRVAVPLGNRVVTGVVVDVFSQAPGNVRRVKTVLRGFDPEPALTPDLLKLGKWMADYYFCSWGEALQAMLPGLYQPETEAWLGLSSPQPEASPPRGLARVLLERLQSGPLGRDDLLHELTSGAAQALRQLQRRGFVRAEKRPVSIGPDLPSGRPAPDQAAPLALTTHQTAAWKEIRKALEQPVYSPFLLHGVTGSGKTEIYLRAIERVLDQGRSAIFLVPEIALTIQIRERIVSRFGPQVEVLHSGLTGKERFRAWFRLRQGATRVVLGARSAVFAPLPNLGLIVVDEEFENSYKQEDAPRYHARDVAAVRARSSRAVLLMGSATPAIETYYNARLGRYRLLTLPERVDGKQLPEIRLVNMATEISPTRQPVFSQILLDEVERRLEAREQSILFLNRRGFAPVVMCPACGHVLLCTDCSLSLVYHRWDDRLHCHQCGRVFPPRPSCPKCGSACVRLAGAGTQRVEEELKRAFPRARVLRVDQDTTQQRGLAEEVFQRFARGEADILIGTQMVAKGFDFQNVTLVGVISADTALHLPDFRAEERTFQLLVQVAGRSGRGSQPGLVLAQTFQADHPIMKLAVTHEYGDFYHREIKQRQDLSYPPFCRLANIICRSVSADNARKTAERLAQRLQAGLGSRDQLLGPIPATRERIAKESRFQLLLKSPTPQSRKQVLSAMAGFKPAPRTRVVIDIDPLNML